MNAEIYYFSGTGNSLVVARDIAGKIKGKLISIPSMVDQGIVRTDAEVIGIVFPVYYIGPVQIPLIVRRFVNQLEDIGSKYIFAVCTYGGGSYTTLKMLSEMLKIRGGKLAAGFGVHMPQNAFEKPYENKQKLFNHWQKKLKDIAEYVRAKKEGRFDADTIVLKLILTPFMPLIKKGLKTALCKMAGLQTGSDLFLEELIPLADVSFFPDEKCNGCGICESVCPVRNIKIVEKKPAWQHHCENCLACFNWCPNAAIHGGIVSDGKRYRHPDVELSDMQYKIDGGGEQNE